MQTYNPDSRIPEVSAGSTLDDVARRDLTLNALYYNVTADTVEVRVRCGLVCCSNFDGLGRRTGTGEG